MRVDDGGLNAPDVGPSNEPPDGHTRVCWATATGAAKRDRPLEEYAMVAERARQMIADGFCACLPLNKGGATRASRKRKTW